MQPLLDYALHYALWTLGNFSLSMFIIAIVLFLLCRTCCRKLPTSDALYRWMACLPLGFTGIYTFVMHAFFPLMAAASVGWVSSPFQFEVAVADLAMGVVGIMSVYKSHCFRVATVIFSTICLWGDAVGHARQILTAHNFANGNAGTWFYMDIILPLVLIICLVKSKKKEPSFR